MYLLHNASKEEDGLQKNPHGRFSQREYKRATKALRSLQPVDYVDPDELEEPLAPPDEIPTDSDSDARSMGPPGTAALSKKGTFKLLHIFIHLYIFIYF